MKKREHNEKSEEKVLLEFLYLTKDGKYAPIDKSSLDYARFNDNVEQVEEELYFHNMTA